MFLLLLKFQRCKMSEKRIEMMKTKAELGVVGFSRYLKVKAKYDKSPICFVEGKDDPYYYYQRVKIKCDLLSPQFINCKGKNGVVNAIKEVIEKTNDNKVLAFVDKDFDTSLGYDFIYETPCYSIENLYVNKESFREICKYNLNIKDERILGICVELFESRMLEFFDCIRELNAWIAYHVKKGNSLNLQEKKLNKYIDINLEKVRKKYTLGQLFESFKVEDSEFDYDFFSEVFEAISDDPIKKYRGKYNIHFLREFLKLICKELGENENFFGQKVKVTFQLSKDGAIKELQQYADTPKCLIDYITSMWGRETSHITMGKIV